MSDDPRIQSSVPAKPPERQEEVSLDSEVSVKRRTPAWTIFKLVSGWSVVALLVLQGLGLLQMAHAFPAIPLWRTILGFVIWPPVVLAVLQAVLSERWSTDLWQAAPLWRRILIYAGWTVVSLLVAFSIVACLVALFIDAQAGHFGQAR